MLDDIASTIIIKLFDSIRKTNQSFSGLSKLKDQTNFKNNEKKSFKIKVKTNVTSIIKVCMIKVSIIKVLYLTV